MSPYRQGPPIWIPRPRRKKSAREHVGIAILAVTIPATQTLGLVSVWLTPLGLLFIVVGLTLLLMGKSRNPLTRLARLTWNHGDRFGAAMLWFGVITPSYSQKRIARSCAAMLALQAELPPTAFTLIRRACDRDR